VSRARSWTRAMLVLVLVGAVGAAFAGSADAYTKKQKRHIQRVLLHQLKKHPRLIKNRRWVRKASHVNEVLPLTIRLNPIVDGGAAAGTQPALAASDDTAKLDLSDTFGPLASNKVTTLSGVVNVDAVFGNPQDGDNLGDLRIVVTGANLSAASVGVLENSAAAACAGPLHQSPDNTYSTGGTSTGPGTTVSAASLAPSVDPNTVVRTAPIPLTLASTAAPNVGTANLFTQTNNVRLSLHVNAAVNTIFRALDDGTGGSTLALGAGSFPFAAFNCDEAFAAQTTGSGVTGNVIPVNVTGSLNISPAITTDGRLRIAKVNVSSPAATHSTVDACLQIAAGTQSPHALGTETALGFPTGTISSATPPVTGCDDTYVPSAPGGAATAGFGLANLGVQEISPAGAKRLHLSPDVTVLGLTGEALIGTYGA
jgi:hypothetical protein